MCGFPVVRVAEAAEQTLGLGGVDREEAMGATVANNGARQEVDVDNELDV